MRQSTADINHNLDKTAELINTVFTLKLAWLKARHPEWSEAELHRAIYRGILKRKEQQWTSPAAS
ncbi:MAG: hypothetical protein FIB02_09680 [Desulfuromonas sp.]|nr:hypothetical protein [Desulfuromonas sp.]